MRSQAKLLNNILRVGGLLAKVVEGYEPRPQQVAMGERVLEALCAERILIVEAPTGVGKTMAYLVPAALYARAEHEPVIVSSYTRALQDQILRQEAPRLKRLVHPDLQIKVLKGRGNYLCRRRWELFVADEASGPDGRWVIDHLEAWVQTTETGAFSEAPDLGRRAGWAFARIGGETRFCRSRLCRAAGGCFHKRARREARDADLVVVNHSLLLADALSGGVLPDHRALIVDEAHLLPDAALEPLSRRVAEKRFEERVRLMGGSGDPGVSDRVRRVLRQIPGKVTAKNLAGRVREFEEVARGTLVQTRAFFTALREGPEFPRLGERRRYTARDCLGALLPADTDQLLTTAGDLIERGRLLIADVAAALPGDEAFRGAHDGLEAADSFVGELEEQLGTLKSLIAPESQGYVHVLEASPTRGAVLSALPLDTGPALREHLLEPHASVILTSATLGAGDDFSYFSRQVGIEAGEAETLVLASPFDMPAQLLTLVPTFAVDPREAGYSAFLADTIAKLAEALPRKTLVLFTAYQTLDQVRENLRHRDELAALQILAQSRETPRARVIEAFRQARKALLLGTASFWQGVDFPGSELELLIVTRLPFPVPTDPRVAAIAEELEQEGRSSFREYSLPEAVLRLRQGVGRLIRRSDDRGVCVILDPRVMRARYGEVFRAALPSNPRAVDTPAALRQAAQDWFAGG